MSLAEPRGMRFWWLAMLIGCATKPKSDPVEPDSLLFLRKIAAVHIQATDTEVLDGAPPVTTPPTVEVDIDNPFCDPLSPNARVSIGLASVPIANPVVDPDGNCTQAQARMELPVGTFAGQPVTIEIADETDRRRIAVAGLSNDLLQLPAQISVGTSATMTWQDGPHIDNGCFRVVDDTSFPIDHGCKFDPNIRFPASPGNTVEVDVSALWPQQAKISFDLVGEYDEGFIEGGPLGGPPLVCDGPASCQILLAVNRTIPVTVLH